MSEQETKESLGKIKGKENDLTYNELLTCSRNLTMGDLYHVLEIDALKHLVIELKRKELENNILYHNLVRAVDKVIEDDYTQASIYEEAQKENG